MKKYYYKLVRKAPIDNVYYSAMVYGRYRMEYRIGETTKAYPHAIRAKHGICVFDSIDSAVGFSNGILNLNSVQLLKVEAEGFMDCSQALRFNMEEIEKYTLGQLNKKFSKDYADKLKISRYTTFITWPKGTLMFKQITPIKLVDIYEYARKATHA